MALTSSTFVHQRRLPMTAAASSLVLWIICPMWMPAAGSTRGLASATQQPPQSDLTARGKATHPRCAAARRSARGRSGRPGTGCSTVPEQGSGGSRTAASRSGGSEQGSGSHGGWQACRVFTRGSGRVTWPRRACPHCLRTEGRANVLVVLLSDPVQREQLGEELWPLLHRKEPRLGPVSRALGSPAGSG